ncbi:MAG: hypothetical protein DWQ39_07005 [Bacteroidetes bacterium]|nr:MAG: hypothetical protein DWQ33_00715 [Bacteroidota bacterium]REK04956.1 MAG: hypothetical protein DWQ39_07005 [Bacteroidota bacterium]REK50906.1 MAG: hypothetical protein DWQ48_02110 [Bacteroidota bacterium]
MIAFSRVMLSARFTNIAFRITSVITVLIFFSCGSDRQGDEIGTLMRTEYPENYEPRKAEIAILPNVKGPEDISAFPARIPTKWLKYSQGSRNRMAVLLTDTNSSWLGIVHGLKTIGIPFIITTDYRRALSHKVVMVYPVISGAVLSPEALQALAAFPRNGGTLVGVQVLGALNEVFGFEEPIPSKQHFEIRIVPDSNNAITSQFRDEKEMTISIGNKVRFRETIGTYSYSKSHRTPLATYEDKSAAITQKDYESGSAYAFGFDLGYLFLKADNIRHEYYNRSTSNDYEPTVDVLLRMLRSIYLRHDRDAAYISTVPYHKNLTVCITHNVNFRGALHNALAYAEEEKKLDIRSTWFIQTKYIRDRRGFILQDESDHAVIRKLNEMGMDVQSNGVCGSPVFDQLPQGSGREVYPDYRPYVMAYQKTYNASIYGEMRVSRFLIDRMLPESGTLFFRSSFPYTPFSYPQSLLGSGYRFSSSVYANSALSHFPVQMNYNREFDAELEAFEFPITDDGELPPYTMDRAASAIRLARKIANYGGCFIGQVNPNMLGLKVQNEFVKAMKDEAWFGTIRDFGLWWNARNEVTLDINYEGGRRVVTLNVPKRMEGLAVMLPIRSTPEKVEGGGKHSIDGKLIIFELAEGKIRITLDN